jgi:hypothetical protein
MANNDQNKKDVDQAAVDAVLIEVDFPATREDLVSAAEDANVDETVIVLFQDLPDEDYASGGDVNKAISKRSGKKAQS